MNSNVSTRISNPGCYASAMQFSILPIKSMIKGKIHSFGISGYSGAGASPNKRNNLKNLENNSCVILFFKDIFIYLVIIEFKIRNFLT